MNSTLKHFSLVWGIFHNFIYALLSSQSSILLRICKLPPQHMLGFSPSYIFNQLITPQIIYSGAWLLVGKKTKINFDF